MNYTSSSLTYSRIQSRNDHVVYPGQLHSGGYFCNHLYTSPGLCSIAFVFAKESANAAFALALALAFDCHVMAAFALTFAFHSSAFAFALAS